MSRSSSSFCNWSCSCLLSMVLLSSNWMTFRSASNPCDFKLSFSTFHSCSSSFSCLNSSFVASSSPCCFSFSSLAFKISCSNCLTFWSNSASLPLRRWLSDFKSVNTFFIFELSNFSSASSSFIFCWLSNTSRNFKVSCSNFSNFSSICTTCSFRLSLADFICCNSSAVSAGSLDERMLWASVKITSRSSNALSKSGHSEGPWPRLSRSAQSGPQK